METVTNSKILQSLENRLKICRNAIGRDTLESGSFPSLQGDSSQPIPTDPSSTKGESSRASQRSLVFEICLLQDSVSKLLKPPFPEFEAACATIASWLDDPSATVKGLLQSNAAKRTFVLQHEELLSKTADQLRQVKELLGVISASTLQDFQVYNKQIKEFEQNGALLSEEVIRLNQGLHELASLFNRTMNMIAGTFKSWDEELEILESKE